MRQRLDTQTRTQLWFSAILFPMIPAGLLALTFDSPKGPAWAVWLLRVLLVGSGVAAWHFLSRPRLLELRRRRDNPQDAEPTPAPKPAAPKPQAVADLWLPIIFPAVFGGLGLCVPILGTNTEGGPWGTFFAVLLVSGFFGTWVTVVGVVRLKELARRGEWTPPGVTSHPVWVAVAVTALLMATTIAAMLTLMWVVRLCSPPS